MSITIFDFFKKVLLNVIMERNREIEIKPNVIFKIIALIFVLFFLFSIKNVLILVFFSYLISIALQPLIKNLIKKTKKRIFSIALVYLNLLGLIVLISALVIPNLFSEISNLFNLINRILIENQIDILKLNITQLQLSLQEYLQITTKITSFIGVLGQSFSNLFQIFALVVMSFYFSLFKQYFYEKIILLTKKYLDQEKILKFFKSIEKQLGSFVRAKFIAMSFIGISTFLSLKLISVPFALTLAMTAFFLEILPNLGPTIALIPAVIVAWSVDIYAALITLAFGLILQKIENTLITPKLKTKNSHVDPLLTIILILIGFSLKGLLGAIIAVPTYIIIRTWYSIFLKNKIKK